VVLLGLLEVVLADAADVAASVGGLGLEVVLREGEVGLEAEEHAGGTTNDHEALATLGGGGSLEGGANVGEDLVSVSNRHFELKGSVHERTSNLVLDCRHQET